MRTLVDRDLYHRDADRGWPRARLLSVVVFALCWGAGMFVFFVVGMRVAGILEPGDVHVMAVLCLMGSLLVASLGYDFALPSEREKQRALLDRVYDGDPAVVPPPPPADEYPLRLPCALVLGPGNEAGGVMYLGERGFLFVPHLLNAPAVRQPLPIGPVRTIRVERVHLRTSWLARVYAGRDPQGLRMSWRDGAALFSVPDPAGTERRIDAELARWKFAPPPAEPEAGA